MATLDQAYFAREIKAAYQKRSDKEQEKKQNFIEIETEMHELIIGSQYLSKGKFLNCISEPCRFERQSNQTVGKECEGT